MEVDQGKKPGYGASFIPTCGDVSPSAGRCKYDGVSHSGIVSGRILPDGRHLSPIFNASLGVLGESELWLFCKEKFIRISFTLAKQELRENKNIKFN